MYILCTVRHISVTVHSSVRSVADSPSRVALGYKTTSVKRMYLYRKQQQQHSASNAGASIISSACTTRIDYRSRLSARLQLPIPRPGLRLVCSWRQILMLTDSVDSVSSSLQCRSRSRSVRCQRLRACAADHPAGRLK